MLDSNIALVASSDEVPLSELTTVAAALLQVQATRDCGPLWNVAASVTPFTKLDDVPVGHWPIIVQANINQPGAGGFHTDQNKQPMALVQYAADWPLVASHEMLEMLIDPFGNRLVPGPSIDPAHPQNRVQYLVEACDPVEDAAYSYTINGVAVSDFITPAFHAPAGTIGARYDFVGAVTAPRMILNGGYISWLDSDLGGWFQLTNFAGAPNQIRALRDVASDEVHLSSREFVHRASPESQNAPTLAPAQRVQVGRLHEKSTRASGAKARQMTRFLSTL